MSNEGNGYDERGLVVAIIDFLRDQLQTRNDFLLEDRDCIEMAIQCLETAYELDSSGYAQHRFARPLMDIFHQVIHPISVKDKLTAENHKDKGNDFMRQGSHQLADEEYSRAIQLDPWNAVYYCNRAIARIELHLYFEAISDCRQALLINPDYAKAYARMGQAYAMLRSPREAARSFQQAVQLEPDNERYRHNLQVAESQIPRPNAAELMETVLGSLFGTSNIMSDMFSTMPSAFMIVTESRPATVSESDEDIVGQPAEDSRGRRLHSQRRDGSNTMIHFPPPYGVVNEAEEEKPIQKSDRAKEKEHSDVKNKLFLEIPYFSEPQACTSKQAERTENYEEAIAEKSGASRKRVSYSQPRALMQSTSNQRARQTELQVTERSTLRYPFSEISKNIQDKLNQTIEFVEKSIHYTTENLHTITNGTSVSPTHVLEDVMLQILTKVDETKHFVNRSFATASRRLQASRSSQKTLKSTLCTHEAEIMSKIDDTKEFIKVAMRNMRHLYQASEGSWEKFTSSIYMLSDQIKNELICKKEFVASSLKKANMLFSDATAQTSKDLSAEDPWEQSPSEHQCFRYSGPSPPLTPSKEESGKLEPGLSRSLSKAIKNVIENFHKVDELVKLKILEAKKCMQMTLEQIKSTLEHPINNTNVCVYLDSIEGDMHCRIYNTIQIADQYLTEAEDHLNHALENENYCLVFELNDVKLELKNRLLEAEQHMKESIRSIDLDTETTDIEGLRDSQEKQLDETQGLIEECLKVGEKYFVTLLDEAKDTSPTFSIDNLSKAMLGKIKEFWLAVKTSFESGATDLRDKQLPPEDIRDILFGIHGEINTKAWELTRFVNQCIYQAQYELEAAVDSSGGSANDHIEEIESNALSEIGKINDFVGTSMQNLYSEVVRKAAGEWLFSTFNDILSKIGKDLSDFKKSLKKSFDELKKSIVIPGEESAEYPLSLFIYNFSERLNGKIDDVAKTLEDSFEVGKKSLRDSWTQDSLLEVLEAIDTNTKDYMGKASTFVLETIETLESYIEADVGLSSEFPSAEEASSNIMTAISEVIEFVEDCISDAKSELIVKGDSPDESLIGDLDKISVKIQKNLEERRDNVEEVIFKLNSEVGEFVLNPETYLELPLTDLSEAVQGQVGEIENMMLEAFQKLNTDTRNMKSISEPLEEHFEATKSDVVEGLRKAEKSLEETFDVAKKSISSIICRSEDPALDTVEKTKKDVLTVIKKLAEFVPEALQISEPPSSEEETNDEEVPWIPDMPEMLTEVRRKIKETKRMVEKDLQNLEKLTTPNLKTVKNNLKVLTSKAKLKVKENLTDIRESVNTTLDNAEKSLKDPGKKAKKTVPDSVDEVKKTIQKRVKAAKADLSDIYAQFESNAIAMGSEELEEPIVVAGDVAAKSLDELLTFTVETLKSAKSAAKKAESEEDNGFCDTFENIKNDLLKKLTETENSCEKGFKDVLADIDTEVTKMENETNSGVKKLCFKFNACFQEVEEALETEFESVKLNLQKTELPTKDRFVETLDGINSTLSKKIDELDKSLQSPDGECSGAMFDRFEGMVKSVMNETKQEVELLLERAKSVFQEPKDKDDKSWLRTLDEASEELEDTLSYAMSSVNDEAKNVLKGIKSPLKATTGPLDNVITDLVRKTKRNIRYIEDTVKDSFITAKDRLQNPEHQTQEGLKYILEDIYKTLETKVSDTEKVLQDLFIPQITGVNQVAGPKELLEKLNISLRNKMQETKEFLKETLDKSVSSLKIPKDGVDDALIDSIDNLKSQILANLSDMKDEIDKDGKRALSDAVKAALLTNLDIVDKDIEERLVDTSEIIQSMIETPFQKTQFSTPESLNKFTADLDDLGSKMKCQERWLIDTLNLIKMDAFDLTFTTDEALEKSFDALQRKLVSAVSEAKTSVDGILDKAYSLSVPKSGKDEEFLNFVKRMPQDLEQKIINLKKTLSSNIADFVTDLKPSLEETTTSALSYVGDKAKFSFQDLESTLKTSVQAVKLQLQKPEFQTQRHLTTCLGDIKQAMFKKIDEIDKSMEYTIDCSKPEVEPTTAPGKTCWATFDKLKVKVKAELGGTKDLVHAELGKAKSTLQIPKGNVDKSWLSGLDQVTLRLQTKILDAKESVSKTIYDLRHAEPKTNAGPPSVGVAVQVSVSIIEYLDISVCDCFKKAKESLRKPENNTQEAFESIVENIKSNLQEKILEAGKTIEDSSAKVEVDIPGGSVQIKLNEFLQNALLDFKKFVEASMEHAKYSTEMLKKGADEFLLKSMDDLKSAFQDRLKEVKGSTNSFAKDLLIADIKVALKDKLNDMQTNIDKYLQDIIGTIKHTFTNNKDQFERTDVEIQDDLRTFIDDFRNGVKKNLKNFEKWLSGFLGSTKTDIFNEAEAADSSLAKDFDAFHLKLESLVKKTLTDIDAALEKAKGSLEVPENGLDADFFSAFLSLSKDFEGEVDELKENLSLHTANFAESLEPSSNETVTKEGSSENREAAQKRKGIFGQNIDAAEEAEAEQGEAVQPKKEFLGQEPEAAEESKPTQDKAAPPKRGLFGQIIDVAEETRDGGH